MNRTMAAGMLAFFFGLPLAAQAQYIASRRSIKQCVGVDTGVVTADVPYFVAWYEAMAADPPILYGDFGYAFCERNTESISGKNYLDYYGDWYDAHYLAIATPSQFDPEPFFKHVESLGIHAAQGIEELRAHWPAHSSFARRVRAGPEHQRRLAREQPGRLHPAQPGGRAGLGGRPGLQPLLSPVLFHPVRGELS